MQVGMELAGERRMDQHRKSGTMQALWSSSQLAGGNAPYVEQLFEAYLHDPHSVPAEWRSFFETLPQVNGGMDVDHAEIRAFFRKLARKPGRASAAVRVPAASRHDDRQLHVLQLINAYRFCGHQQANLNPLGSGVNTPLPELTLAHHGLSEADLDTTFKTGSLAGPDQATLRDILTILESTYTGHIGAEYMHITSTEEKRWLQQRLEGVRCNPGLSGDSKKHLLSRLAAAEGLERFLHTRYVGQKRFSLEGGESLIPLLDEVVQRAGTHGAREIIIGMAHRGRLNVLVNIMGKQPADLFREFEGKARTHANGSGDVKYHMGFSSNINTPGGAVHVALAFNPSHLEIVAPVVGGSVRARQDRRYDAEGTEVMSVLIHGDAAFAGQGVVMENFNMSQSRGYSTKGTVHIVINNQIGFTTSDRQDARSSLYCTDVAKMVNAPIFHVDGDDPEAVVFVTQAALDYRTTFRKDVVIDMVCYRRHGHSEADEPMVTQPVMYKRIRDKRTTHQIYAQRLVEEGHISEADARAVSTEYRRALEADECVVPGMIPDDEADYPYAVDWSAHLDRNCLQRTATAVPLEQIRQLTERLLDLPKGFELHPSAAKIYGNRRKMAAGSLPIDWGYAETMAYATLLMDGYGVRLSGQDAGRGTFFHRHAVLYDQHDGRSYIPLRHLDDKQGNFLVINSLLSEEAVLAFEYGYATTDPRTLTLWEAQFGDFANNAQVVIDQFISAGEQKWRRLCGLVMLLPHGYEGQGPEHTSARLERYLQLCAEHNIQVCMPTTPAQIFHLLRRQMHQRCRKPLIIMSPKSLLRHRLAVSTLEDLSDGMFQRVIPEVDSLENDKVARVVLCSGKVYYDLLEKRRELERNDVAIIRLEQLYPFPRKNLEKQIQRYANAGTFIWCQEEPLNQGAWFPSQHHMRAVIGDAHVLEYAGRPMSAAPAVGQPAVHLEQQHALVAAALGLSE